METLSPQENLKKYFGYDSFRPQQEEIIDSVMNGKDALVIMPTGGGKSVCYQIPAVSMRGVAIVISPLIALMKDQVDGLRANGIPAAFLNSTLETHEELEIVNKAVNGSLKLIYVSPERLLSGSFMHLLRKLDVSLFAVDEAHCISSWGHDFRPEYTQLAQLKREFSSIPIIALTATADKSTRGDIAQQLNLQDPTVSVSSFDRPNLSLTVFPAQNRYTNIKIFLESKPNQAGIIYCLSRKGTEKLATKLSMDGYKAAAYHAGLPTNVRDSVQGEFLNDQIQIVCATVAFGMGIDKSNVRWVIHYNLPKNIEGYYQEIGRAGRDGLPSDTMLFFSYGDVVTLKSFISSERRELEEGKLKRMTDYAEARVCRRKVLLGYFGEVLEENCGNCDVCHNPPTYSDGTVLAQKALSAVYRMGERAGIQMTVDVLRGAGKKDIYQRGYDKIKTYGAGREHSNSNWMDFMGQFINLGLLEISFENHGALNLTQAGRDVLFEGNKVDLAAPKEKTSVRTTKKVTKTEIFDQGLFESLRALRKDLAANQGVPPYLVFSDATLKHMAGHKPVTPMEMKEVSGVGEKKFQQYGDLFINRILGYVQDNQATAPKTKGSTYLITLSLLKDGKTADQIATERDISVSTVMSHLIKLKEEGHDIDLDQYVNESEIQQVKAIISELGKPENIKPIFEALNEELSYGKIRIALYLIEQHGEMV